MKNSPLEISNYQNQQKSSSTRLNSRFYHCHCLYSKHITKDTVTSLESQHMSFYADCCIVSNLCDAF